MVQPVPEYSDKIGFSFESDAAASFLVAKCAAGPMEYQALMLERNCIRHVIPVNIIIKEGVTCFYYDITSKISLSFFLNRRKLNREEFLKLLLQITAAVNDSAGYLLTASNFIFDPEHIYISPETLEPALIYVPAALEESCRPTIQGFISDLLLQHINIDGFGGGNLVQRMLSAVNSEIFHMKGLIKLLNELLYGQEQEVGNTGGTELKAGGKQEKEIFEESREEGKWCKADQRSSCRDRKAVNVNDAVDKKEMTKNAADVKTAARGRPSRMAVLAIVAQVAMGAAIYMGRGFLNNVSNKPTGTYAAVGMIVLAVEVLIFRKLSEIRLINVEASGKSENQNITGQDISVRGNRAMEKPDSPVRGNRIMEKPDSLVSGNRVMEKPDSLVSGNRVMEKSDGPVSSNTVMEKPDSPVSGNTIVEAKGNKAGGEVENGPQPEYSSSDRTELLGNRTGGIRVLKSVGRTNDEEDILIDKEDFIVGRLSGHVDYVLKNKAVGKLHAQLIYRNGASYIKDLNSVNGTFINDRRIESNKEVELKENDRLQLANSEYVFCHRLWIG